MTKEELQQSSPLNNQRDIYIWVNGATSEVARKYWEQQGWVKTTDREPLPKSRVLVVLDYSDFKRDIRIETANVYEVDKIAQSYGGPNALESGIIKYGIFFTLPAIIPKHRVTYWRELPPPPSQPNNG